MENDIKTGKNIDKQVNKPCFTANELSKLKGEKAEKVKNNQTIKK
jgi:hypothetical protein